MSEESGGPLLHPFAGLPGLSQVAAQVFPSGPAPQGAAVSEAVVPAGSGPSASAAPGAWLDVVAATVVAQVEVACAGLDRPEETHRVWIHRDGTVTTPDHPVEVTSTAEQVASALGDATRHACGYWSDVPALTLAASGGPVPVVAGWRLRAMSMWSTKAMWTALSGVLGRPVLLGADPVMWLAYAQVFEAAGGLPEDPVTHLGYLSAPWTRPGGWRRDRVTLPTEVAGLLAAGVPVGRVGSAAALGFTPEVARVAVAEARRLRLPADVIVHAAHALGPERVAVLLAGLDHESGAGLPGRLSALGRVVGSGWSEDDVEAFVRGA